MIKIQNIPRELKHKEPSYEVSRKDKLKEALTKLKLQTKKLPKIQNLFLKFNISNQLVAGVNTLLKEKFSSETFCKNFTPINKNDILFIQELSPIIKEKASDIVKLQDCTDAYLRIAQISTAQVKEKLHNIFDVSKQRGLDESVIEEARSYLILWTFFEYFCVYKYNRLYLLGIRKLFYFHMFQPNLKEMEIYKKTHLSDYEDADFLDSEIKKVKFCLSHCQFSELSEIFKQISIALQPNEQNESKYFLSNSAFMEIYNDFAGICESYNSFITQSGDFSAIIEIDHFKKDFERLERDTEAALRMVEQDLVKNTELDVNIKNETDWLIHETRMILSVFCGDVDGISKLCENVMENILMHVYYRFYFNDFYDTLANDLKEKYAENCSGLDHLIISLICQDPYEFLQECKKHIPDWFYFHLLDVLDDLERIPLENDPNLDGMTFKEYEYVEFLHYLNVINVPYIDFLNYFTLLRANDATCLQFLEKITTRSVIKEFSLYEHKRQKYEDLLSHLKTITSANEIMKDSKSLFLSIAKICFDRFMDMNLYLPALDYYALASLTESEVIPHKAVSLTGLVSEKEFLIDKFFYHILKINEIPAEFIEILTIPNDYYAYPKVEYLVNLVDISNMAHSTKEMTFNRESKMKTFFYSCFIEEKCPAVMWLWTLKLFKSISFSKKIKYNRTWIDNSEILKEIVLNDYKIAFNNHCNNEPIIKKAMMKFYQIVKGDDGDYEKLIDNEYASCSYFLFNQRNFAFSA